MMYYVAGVTKCGFFFEKAFITYKQARGFADSVLLRVKGYRIEKRGQFRQKLVMAATVIATLSVLAFPCLALADEQVSTNSSQSSSNKELTSAEVAQEVERIDYRDVVNPQVVGDFFFVMLVDTALLTLNLGALAFLTFRPAR